MSSSLGGFSGILLNQGQTSGNYYVFFCANAVTAGTWPSTCGAQTPNNSSGQSYAWGIFIH